MKFGNFNQSNTFRVLFIGFLILLLLIPMGMVESIITERGYLNRQATDEITASWGREQLVVGPILSLPYLETRADNGSWIYDTRYRHLRPASMAIDVNIETQIRHRSIYKVPVYTADVHIQGEIDLADVAFENFNTSEFEIDEGYIQIPVGDPRAIKELVSFSWDGEEITLEPRWHGSNNESVSLAVDLPMTMLARDTVHRFDMVFKLAGSKEIGFVSSSPDTLINIDANWGSPGFFGIYLPSEYTIDDDMFTASWDINDLLSALGNEQSELLSSVLFPRESRFGVALVQSVDTYQLVTRATKYSVLFISLSFLVYFFTEVMTRMSLHPVQYLLVGGANCLFYLLLLSLAEHIDFSLAYFLSALASASLITLYSISILKSRQKAMIIFTMLTGLYSYLFVTLRSEAYALLIGSIGLFVILGLVMYLTRNIDWDKTGPVIPAPG